MEAVVVLVIAGWLTWELMRKSPTTTVGSILWLIVYVPLCLVFIVALIISVMGMGCELSNCLGR